MLQQKIYNYFHLNPSLKILFFFDAMNECGEELAAMEWVENYRYVEFDGNWFYTQYRLEKTWENEKVILHFKGMQSPKNTQSMLDFPLLDLLKANMEFQRGDSGAFMQQFRIPGQWSQFVQRHIGALQSNKFFNVLKNYYSSEEFHPDVLLRGFLSVYLGSEKVLGWERIIIKLVSLGSEAEQTKREQFFRKMTAQDPHILDVKNALDATVKEWLGVSIDYNSTKKLQQVVESLKYNAICQSLVLLPSDPYKSYKINESNRLERLNQLFELVSTLPIRESDKFKIAFNELGADIKEEKLVELYGGEADYFYLTEKMAWLILKALMNDKLTTCPEEVLNKLLALEFKVKQMPEVDKLIVFMQQVARFYLLRQQVDMLFVDNPVEYLTKYTTHFYQFDSVYRKANLSYYQLDPSAIPVYESTEKYKKQLDVDYAKFTFTLNNEWMASLKARNYHFAELPCMKQQEFYVRKVENYPNKIAVIVSDALRYEVAVQLLEEMNKYPRAVASLDYQLGMLPSETKYAKPVLLPHRKLTISPQGTLLDEGQQVATIAQRTAHLQRYVEDAVCINMDTYHGNDRNKLRELFKRKVIYVYHDVIDRFSHSDDASKLGQICEDAVTELAKMVKYIHATLQVKQVIITADHGFIFNDQPFEEKDKQSIQEGCDEATTRYYITSSSDEVYGITKIPFSRIIDVEDDRYIALPFSTNRLKGSGGYGFAHGGASLQEMVVPVVTSYYDGDEVKEKVPVMLMSPNLSIVSSRLKFRLIQTEPVSASYTERKIFCGIYENDRLVSTEQTLLLNSSSADLNARVREIELVLNQPTQQKVMKLKIFDPADSMLNTLLEGTVTNNTLIENDFD